MKAKMSVAARMALSAMLTPLAGDSARLLMYRKFREGLSLSEEENELVGLNTHQIGNELNTFMRYPEKDPMKEIEVGEIITEVACGKLRELEETKALAPTQLDLFLIFKPEIDKIKELEKK